MLLTKIYLSNTPDLIKFQCKDLWVLKVFFSGEMGKIGIWASLMVQTVKNSPAVQETQVRSLGREDPLEKEMATHSRILAWKISWMEEPGGLQSMGSQRVRHD